MKVMSVVSLVPSKHGSFEEYTITMTRRLTAAGDESILVFRSEPPAHLRTLYDGAVLESKPFGSFDLESGKRLYALIRKHRPDIVHLHFVPLLSCDVVAARLATSTKVVFSNHNSDIPKRRSLPKRVLLKVANRMMSSLMDLTITPSNYVKRRVVRDGTKACKVATIHNGVALERFRGQRESTQVLQSLGVERRTLVVLSVSQVIPEKGIGVLIEAANLVRKTGADVAFVHVGTGPFLEQYKSRVSSLDLDDRFHFTGLLNLPEIAELLKLSDVCTLPCTWGEAFALSILEGLAAGKPVIVSNVGGNPEAVSDGENGLTVPPNDPHELAHAILKLYENPALRARMANESLRRSSYFSVSRWVDETILQYRRLLGLPRVEAAAEPAKAQAAAHR